MGRREELLWDRHWLCVVTKSIGGREAIWLIPFFLATQGVGIGWVLYSVVAGFGVVVIGAMMVVVVTGSSATLFGGKVQRLR